MTARYSIAIRTLGKAGLKFEKTLRSISNQTIQPEEVFVVIPHGYPLPDLPSWCKVIRSEKGMVKQRVAGIESVSSPLTMLLDDDLEFEPEFAEQLIDISVKNNNCFVSPSVASSNMPARQKRSNKFQNLIRWCIGTSWECNLNDGYALKITNTGGFKYDAKLDVNKVYLTQSGHGAIFFGPTQALKSMDFISEDWLEDSIYAWPDDQIEYYKLYINGYKLLFAPKLTLIHLDAGTSVSGDKKYHYTYSATRNIIIFWHRFLFSQRKFPIGPFWGISRRVVFTMTSALIKAIKNRNFSLFGASYKGYRDGFRYIRSENYRKLNSPIIK